MKRKPKMQMPTTAELNELPPERRLSDEEREQLGQHVKRYARHKELYLAELETKRALLTAEGHQFAGYKCRICGQSASHVNIRRPLPKCTVRVHRRVLVCRGENSHYACADCGLEDADTTRLCPGPKETP